MNTENKFKRNYLPLIILQVVSALLLAAVVICIKYVSKDTFVQIKNTYNKYFENKTVEAKTEEVAAIMNFQPIAYVNANANELGTESINSFCTPLKGVITSRFGEREDPFSKDNKMHKGTDIAGEYGKEILAAQDGVVSYVGYEENGYGNYVSIAHGDTLKTVYAHCSKVLVKKGETVKKGQKIALVGSTGASTGNHLHFEIRINNLQVNAEEFVDFS